MSFFCIYSGREWPEGERSDEHVLAYALGGSSRLVTRDVARTPNNTCGTTADSFLINNFWVAHDRWRLKLKSEGGTVPPIEFDGTVELDGQKVRARYSITPELEMRLRLTPLVEGSLGEKGYRVLCEPGQVEEIYSNIAKKAARKGLSIAPIDGWEKQVRTVEKPEMSASFQFDINAFALGFVKMGLGFGHLELGYDWSRSPSADLLRAVLNAPHPVDWTAFPVRGGVWPNGVPQLTPLLRVDDDHHVFLLQNQSPLVFYGLLFGKFDGLIRLHEGVWPGLQVPPGDGIIYLVHAPSRTVERMKFTEFLLWKQRRMA